MSPRKPIVKRESTLVLELVAPLHIGSGEPDGGSDAGVVRDFNGLPGLPGTSIQGMLRAAVEELFWKEESDKLDKEIAHNPGFLSARLDEACKGGSGKTSDGEVRVEVIRRLIEERVAPRVERIFGHSSKANRGTGRGGRLSVSWGVIHTQHNQPEAGRITSTCRDSDPVLRDAARPMLRDHVRLTERGVAAQRGKFDELVVSAGHRFTVQLRFVTAPEEEDLADTDWQILETVLRRPGLRLGGKTCRGLGAFKVVGAPDVENEGVIFVGKLSPETLWMFGGGTSESADSAPVSGTRIVWDDDQGRVQPVWIIPGSAVKGALVHRTAFHANRLARNFIDDPDGPEKKKKCEDVKALMDELFGCIHGEIGTRGKVFIDDVFIDLPSSGNGKPDLGQHLAGVQNHVAINPFTGGAKDSALFNDEPLRPKIKAISLTVQLRGELQRKIALQVNGKTEGYTARDALAAALKDLEEGRLALGAHAGRGYGIFAKTQGI